MLKKDQPRVSFRAMPKVLIEFQRHARKHRVTNDNLFQAYVKMAKQHPESLEKFLE